MSRIRVVLADDFQPIVAKVRGILDDEFEVIGTAENGNQAVDSVLTLDADVLITDISMPVVNGLQAAERLQMANCRARILFSPSMKIRNMSEQHSLPGLPPTS